MKRLITVLFVLAALVLALHPLYASEPPFAPVAVCNKGKCVMSEKDYKTYQEWHFALIEKLKALVAENSELADENAGLHGKIASESFCEAHRD